MSHTSSKKRFNSIPSLPMFLVERDSYSGQMNVSSGSPRSDVGQQSQDTAVSYVTQSTSDINSSVVDVDCRQRPARRSRKNSQSDGRHATVELIAHVHGKSKPTKPARKTRLKHRHLPMTNEEGPPEMMFSGCVLGELEQTNKSSRRDSVHSSTYQKSLAKEVERLTLANSQLMLQLQAYDISLDSSYQETAQDKTSFTREGTEPVQLEQLSLLEDRCRALEKERNHYQYKLAEMQKQVTGGPGNRTKVESLQKQNHELSEDLLMMKNLVCRLNAELRRYQDRLRASGDEPPSLPRATLTPDEGTVTIERGTLHELFEAYDETIKEKDDLINNYEKDINNFSGKCKEVIAENERLHRDVKAYQQKAEEANECYNVLHHDAAIAQDQNALLVNQLEIQKNKIAEVHAVYRNKVSELTTKNEQLLEQHQRSHGDLLTLKGKHAALREELDRRRADLENTVTLAAHTAAVDECRRLLIELRAKHEADRERLTSRLEEAAAWTAAKEKKAAEGRAECAQLEAQIEVLERELKKYHAKCEEFKALWMTATRGKDTAKRQLQRAMALSRELVVGQEHLVKELQAKREESDFMAKMSTNLVNRMGILKSNLKDMQTGAWLEIDTMEQRITQQESGVGRMKEEYKQETMKLQNIVHQKEEIIQRLKKEKAEAEESLEVVWKAVAADESRAKETQLTSNAAPDDSSSEDKF